MRYLMRRCQGCGTYSLNQTCQCGAQTISPQPPRYSPQDRYGKYRRKLKTTKKH